MKRLIWLVAILALLPLQAPAQTTGVPKPKISSANFGSTTSTELRSILSDATGTGAAVFGTGPTIVFPAAGTTFNGSSSGSAILKAPATAAGTITLPGATSTLAILGANSFTETQTITPATANSSALVLTGGTITALSPLVDMTRTWNAGGVTFTALKLNVTDTASASASLLMDLQLGGSSMIKVDKSGNVTAPNFIGTQNVRVDGGAFYFNAKSAITNPGADGTIMLSNNAQSAFTRLQFGGTTSSFPSIGRSGATLQFALADGSGWANTQGGRHEVRADAALTAGGATTMAIAFSSSAMLVLAGSGAPTVAAAKGSLYLRSDGSSTSTRIYVNTDGSTGWTNLTSGS